MNRIVGLINKYFGLIMVIALLIFVVEALFIIRNSSSVLGTSTEQVAITPTLQPTASPTYESVYSTPVPSKYHYVAPTNDPDPVIDCIYKYLGTQKIRSSLCNIQFECNVGGKWYFYTDRNKCTTDQNNFYKNSTSNYVPPQNNNYVPPQNNSSTAKSSLISCVVSYPCTGNSYTYQTDQATCNTWQQQANNTCGSSQSTQSNNANLYQQCRDNITTQYNSAMAQINALGSTDSSAVGAAASARQRGLADCNQRYGQ